MIRVEAGMPTARSCTLVGIPPAPIGAFRRGVVVRRRRAGRGRRRGAASTANRPLDVHQRLADPTIPTFQKAETLPIS